jgi:predicted nucleic acid-binding protein
MTRDELSEVEVETRFEAALAVAGVVVLQVLLGLVSRAQGWSLWELPWWVWLVLVGPEVALLILLTWSRPRRRLVETGRRRTVSLALVASVGLGNALALVTLLGSILSGEEQSGGQLLLKGIAIWTTNVVAFGLWFWELDRGGPMRRAEPDPPPPDFQFPQMDDAGRSRGGWYPRLVDYVYVSFTNSLAFSPTDAMPLTRRLKLAMLTEASVSSITVLLVAARAINILA